MLKTVSRDYKRLQEKLHKTGKYGWTARTYRNEVVNLIDTYGIKTLLDYGCGSNIPLYQVIHAPHLLGDCEYWPFDPCVKKYSMDPRPSELLVSIDVLEHVEPEYLETVLDHMQELCQRIFYCSVFLLPSSQYMEDGRNAHLICKPAQWWIPKLMDRFSMIEIKRQSSASFTFLASRKN